MSDLTSLGEIIGLIHVQEKEIKIHVNHNCVITLTQHIWCLLHAKKIRVGRLGNYFVKSEKVPMSSLIDQVKEFVIQQITNSNHVLLSK